MFLLDKDTKYSKLWLRLEFEEDFCYYEEHEKEKKTTSQKRKEKSTQEPASKKMKQTLIYNTIFGKILYVIHQRYHKCKNLINGIIFRIKNNHASVNMQTILSILEASFVPNISAFHSASQIVDIEQIRKSKYSTRQTKLQKTH